MRSAPRTSHGWSLIPRWASQPCPALLHPSFPLPHARLLPPVRVRQLGEHPLVPLQRAHRARLYGGWLHPPPVLGERVGDQEIRPEVRPRERRGAADGGRVQGFCARLAAARAARAARGGDGAPESGPRSAGVSRAGGAGPRETIRRSGLQRRDEFRSRQNGLVCVCRSVRGGVVAHVLVVFVLLHFTCKDSYLYVHKKGGAGTQRYLVPARFQSTRVLPCLRSSTPPDPRPDNFRNRHFADRDARPTDRSRTSRSHFAHNFCNRNFRRLS